MKRILIVEDDLDIRAGLQLVLSDRYFILEASNGREALRILAREAVDLMLLDMFMPVLDGMGVLREMAANAWSTPVIVMTAQKDLKDRSKALGVESALLKPFDLAELEQCIARILDPDEDGSPSSEGSGGNHTQASLESETSVMRDEKRKKSICHESGLWRQPSHPYSLLSGTSAAYRNRF